MNHILKYLQEYYFCTGLKKFTAIFLTTIYLFSSTEAEQFLKLPSLFAHFLDHHQTNGETSMLAFLTNHYLVDETEEDHKSETPEQHEHEHDLPFKSHDHCLDINLPVYIAASNCEIIKNETPEPIRKFRITGDTFPPDHFLSSIWQPPKIS